MDQKDLPLHLKQTNKQKPKNNYSANQTAPQVSARVCSLLKSKAFSLGILTIYKSGMVTVFLRYNSTDSLTTQADLEKKINWKVMSPSSVTKNFQTFHTCQEGYLEVGYFAPYHRSVNRDL